jgi:hypothetical protein
VGDVVTKLFCGVMKTRARTKTDRFWRESEGEDTTTTDLVLKEKARRRKDGLVAKGRRGKYGAKDEVKRLSQATGPTLEQRVFLDSLLYRALEKCIIQGKICALQGISQDMSTRL